MRDTKSEVLSIRVETEILAQLKATAEKVDMPMAWLIRRFLRQGLDRENAPRKKRA